MKTIKIDTNSLYFKAIILFLVFATLMAAIFGTNILTRPKVDKTVSQTNLDNMAEVLAAESYTQSHLKFGGKNVPYYIAIADSQTIGYIFTASANGYGGDINVMVGINSDGTLSGIKVLSAYNETTGYEQKLKKQGYYDTFKGAKKDTLPTAYVAGATYSAKAVKASVEKAYMYYESVMSALTKDKISAESDDIQEENTQGGSEDDLQ